MRAVSVAKRPIKFRSPYPRDESAIEKGLLIVRMKTYLRGIRLFLYGWGNRGTILTHIV